MNLSLFAQYENAMHRLQAEESLLKLKLADYPNMKKEARNKLHKAFEDIADPIEERKVLTSEELAAKLGMI